LNSGRQSPADRARSAAAKPRNSAILRYARRVRIVCPICKTVLENAPDDFEPRPFCSARCKLVDLGNWLSDAYRIPTNERPEDDENGFGPS
jgi:endogenous inhibitor of DNA gyrase (YacG/DUF329 family)